jgi:predicted transport protein
MMDSIEEIIRLREEVIQKLLDHRVRLKSEQEELAQELVNIARQLERLGYEAEPADEPKPRMPASVKRRRRSTQGATGHVYSVQQHLAPRSRAIGELFNELAGQIRGLGETVQEVPLRHYVSYRTGRNFCGIIVHASKLRVHLDLPYTEMHDPQAIAEDCSTIGHWPSGNTRFDVRSPDDVEYAMLLIRQSYEWSLQSR